MKLKIVHFIPSLINGGIETMLLNYYNKLKDKFDFVVIIHEPPEESCKKKFENLGIKVYQITDWKDSFLKSEFELYKILKYEKPDIFHSHLNLRNFATCIVAKLVGIKIRISHCHEYFPKKNIKRKFFSLLSKIFATHFMACGKGAAVYLTNEKMVYQSKVYILYNAIDIKKYLFNELKRNKIREENGWNNCLLIGNVGRFAEQKNQVFLIKIYEQIAQINSDARFLIIGGEGPEYEIILQKIKKSTIAEKTTILKNIANVYDYYQAMDFLLLPSLYEGFPVTVVEAQFSNLPCLLSKNIYPEIQNNKTWYISLENVEGWVDILENKMTYNRNDKIDKKLQEQYDINHNADKLMKFYYKIVEEVKK